MPPAVARAGRAANHNSSSSRFDGGDHHRTSATEHETARAIASLAQSPAAAALASAAARSGGPGRSSHSSFLAPTAAPPPAATAAGGGAASVSPPTKPGATLATSIGLGIQSAPAGGAAATTTNNHNVGAPVVDSSFDATEAAIKAVGDALERGQISSVYQQLIRSGAFASQRLFLHVKLGVPPSADPSYALRTVDARRVYEELLQPLGIPVATPLQIVLGGLDAVHSLTVVAALSLHVHHDAPDAPSVVAQQETRKHPSARALPTRKASAAKPPPANLLSVRRADPDDSTERTAAMQRTNSIDVLARISAEMHEEEAAELLVADELLLGKGKGGTAGANYRKLPPGVTPKQNQRLFVKHQYRDHSHEVPRLDEMDMDEDADTSPDRSSPPASSLPKRGSGTSFPVKLHETLRQIETDGLDSVIGWLPHGRSFKIFKQKEFVDVVLPRYFVMTKKSSFLRQLNLYGFTRFCGLGPDQGSYYHEHFLRGMIFLSRRMSRQKVNGNGIRSAGDPDNEPNLGLYPTCPPTKVNHGVSADASHALQLLTGVPADESSRRPSARHLEGGHGPSPAATNKVPPTSLPRTNLKINTTTGRSERVASSMPTTAAAQSPPNVIPDNPVNRVIAAAAMIDSSIRGAQVSFPLKLQRILDKLEADGGFAEVVSWQPHGRAFLVKNASRFVREVMPRYFSMSKFSSFQRQLHMYSFSRITSSGRDKGAYWHPHFARGAPEMAMKMQRTRIRGTGTRKPGNPNLEPDFYGMPSLPVIASGTRIDVPADVVVASDGPKPLKKTKTTLVESAASRHGELGTSGRHQSEDAEGSTEETEDLASEEEGDADDDE